MFRRVIGPQASKSISKTSGAIRCYTNYDHMKYPIYTSAFGCVFGYFFVMFLVFARIGSLFSNRGEYKKDYLRVWRRKLGTGYQWSDAWGPQMDSIWKNVPDSVK